MKILPLGGGAYLEPDENPRHTRWHRRILRTVPIANTKSGYWCDLECGHRVAVFGNLAPANGVLPCTACRDRKQGS
jgi:hypothetical protein